jgi:predicted DNA-binding protein (UPF0251 family)
MIEGLQEAQVAAGRGFPVSIERLWSDLFQFVAQRTHSRCRLEVCVTCLAAQTGLEEQVALMLSDVHGLPDKVSSRRMGMSVPGFQWLLHQTRSRLNRHAGGVCPVVARGGREVICTAAPAARPVDGDTAGRPKDNCYRPYRMGLSADSMELMRRKLVKDLSP